MDPGCGRDFEPLSEHEAAFIARELALASSGCPDGTAATAEIVAIGAVFAATWVSGLWSVWGMFG